MLFRHDGLDGVSRGCAAWRGAWWVGVIAAWLVAAPLHAQPLAAASGADWPQWRGPNRDGAALQSPALIDQLPDSGLAPMWMSETIPSGRDGGWSSPVVAHGSVYLYVHSRIKNAEGDDPKRKYPWLPPDKRGHLTAEEYRQYEVNRRDEDERLSKRYRFEETLWRIDAKTGKTLWRQTLPSVYTRFVQSPTVAVVGGRAYVQGAARTMRCHDAQTGQVLWETTLPGDFRDEFMMSSFAIADGVAAVLAGHLIGLDAVTGQILWEGHPSQTRGTHGSPAVWRHESASYFIVNVNGNDTICVEPATGRELWRVRSRANFATPVILPPNRMITYGNSRRDGLRCFEMSLEGAMELWSYHGAADKGSSPVVVDDHVYLQGERTFACVDLKTGEEKWKELLSLRTPEYTSLVAADGKILYACEGFFWYAADPTTFRMLAPGLFNEQAIIATEAQHRAMIKAKHNLTDSDADQKKLNGLFEKSVGRRHGPLRCASPAFYQGLMFIRLNNGVACYDLRK